ncbi:AhpC/TSA family protein [Mucilaginibacter mali]|uniref:AhpC/TSA family protein n=1 Tax=Mucilaginibacter mali TaxID=2740462 RepID=A0A7D4TLP6_9SPHI|nr:TlpA disulfide reductase family protein [Mucilaginibacter mali]QKJ29433.1 AhpC/TSA family protein [Mucilaginibacter mali]
MYKHLLTKALVIVLLFGSSRLFAQQFTLSGKVTGGGDAWIYLTYQNTEKKSVRDSMRLQADAFAFKGALAEPSRASLMLKAAKNSFASIYLEPTNMIIDATMANFSALKLTGSKTQDENIALQAQLDEVNKGFEPVSANLNRMNKEVKLAKSTNKPEHVIDSLEKELVVYEKQRIPFVKKYEDIARQFIISHPNSYLSSIQMSVYAVSWPLDSVRTVYNSFSQAVKSTTSGLAIKRAIDEREVKAAMPAVNFSKADLNGKTFSLANLKGKYVLLDFWGSWCLPCRQSTPHLKELYAKYHQEGLEVVAIACNDTPYDWKKAIKVDGTALWHNVMDIPRDDTATPKEKHISGQYNVHVFPTKILIDKNGIIIGRYDSDNATALDKKLAEVFPPAP